MMMRLIRKLRGKGLREAEADRLMQEHHRDASKTIRDLGNKVSAAEKLVRELRKDATQWPLC